MNISRASISLLLDSDDYISILTPEGIRKFVNKSYCVFLDRNENEVIGKKFTDGLAEEKVRFYQEHMKKLTPATPTVTINQKNGAPGKEEWISWKATGVFDNNGELLEILVVGKNVNDIIEAREEKDNMSYMLNAFRNAIDTNIICTITDITGAIIYANDNFCNVSKYSREEILGQTHKIVNSGHHPPDFFANMWKRISSGRMWAAEIRNKSKDGSLYWVNAVIIPVKDRNGKIGSYLSLRIPINEQKKLEEERKEYLKSLEDMLFMLSHEIRGPIARCQGLIGLLKESMPTSYESVNELFDYLLTSVTDLEAFSQRLNDKLQHSVHLAYKSK